MKQAGGPKDGFDGLGETFLGMLMRDVVASLERVAVDNGQASRRDLIRTLFAAIEGSVWTYREHVRSVANDLVELSPLTALAFAEQSYVVTENGKVVGQPRYISLVAMIRLTTNLAQTLSPGLKVNFGSPGWSNLKHTIEVRNRLTHPKRKADLAIEPGDVATAWAALNWLLGIVTDVMSATVKSQADYVEEFRVLVDELKKGNPETLKAYRSALFSSDD